MTGSADLRPAAIVAVDGGNSKTEVALVGTDGTVLGTGRAAGSNHQTAGGLEPALAAIAHGIRAAERDAGLSPGASRTSTVGVFCLAGMDLPVDARLLRRGLGEAGVAVRTILHNDAWAGLRAGASAGWGVSIVCGAGVNCVGVGPTGRSVQFPSLGTLSGDWAGSGGHLGETAFGAALRGRDGRGPRTSLERAVPAYFGRRSPLAVLEAVYTGRLAERRLIELAPVALAEAAAGDAVARAIVDDLADELARWAVAAIRRLGLARRPVEVVMAGGVFRTTEAGFHERVRAGILAVAPGAIFRRLEAPPVVGAALLGADDLRLGPAAEARIRHELTRQRLDGGGPGPVLR